MVDLAQELRWGMVILLLAAIALELMGVLVFLARWDGERHRQSAGPGVGRGA